MEETSGSGGTYLVHIEVHGIALLNPDVFGVLAAYLKNRVHIRVPENRCPGMGCNLVDNKISLDKISYHMSSRSRSSGSKKLKTVAKFLTYPFQEFLGHFDGLPLGLNVLLVDNVLVRIHEDGLGSSGADVNPQENLKLSTG